MKPLPWLICIFVIVLATRLYFAFNVGFPSEAYFDLREIDSISHTGLPFFNDPFAWNGRSVVFSPVFHYFVGFFALFMPLDFAARIIPNVLCSLLVFIIYGISFKLSKDSLASLFAALISGFIPVFFTSTLMSVSSFCLLLPLLFLMILAILNIPNSFWVGVYLACLILASFVSPAVLVFVFGLLFFVILCFSERVPQDRYWLELLMFSVFFIFWAVLLVYKKVFLFHGINAIWQNLPASLLSEHFTQISVLSALAGVGFIPLFGGAYVLYAYLFRGKRTDLYLIMGLVVAVGVLLWFKLIDLTDGLVLLGLFMVLLSAQGISDLFLFIRTTRFSRFMFVAHGVLLVIFIVSLMSINVPRGADPAIIQSLTWLRSQGAPDETAFAPIEVSDMIPFIANKKTVIDSNFLLVYNAEDRLKDFRRAYETKLRTELVGILDKYGADYFFVPSSMSIVVDPGCFREEFRNSAGIIYFKRESCRVRAV